MRARTLADDSVPGMPFHEPSRIAIIASHASRSRSAIASSVGPIVISRTPGSSCTGTPATAAIASAVSRARRIGLAYTAASSRSAKRSATASACARPRALSGCAS